MSDRCQKEPAPEELHQSQEQNSLSFSLKSTNKCCKEREWHWDCARENPAPCYAIVHKALKFSEMC